MPYIEGPRMDWTVNDGLYHRFLKWWLKCENILVCELAALPEQQKYKKSDCLEQRLWHRPIGLMVLASRRVIHRHNLGSLRNSASLNPMRLGPTLTSQALDKVTTA